MEGTYPLPEAQLDRFLFKIDVKRGDVKTLERIVLNREIGVEVMLEPVLEHHELLEIGALVRRIYLPEVVANFIARLVEGTHPGSSKASEGVKFGASPRAALAMASASKARALLHGRLNASFEDVETIAAAVLRHRVLLDYTAKLSGRTSDMVVSELLQETTRQERAIPSTLQDKLD